VVSAGGASDVDAAHASERTPVPSQKRELPIPRVVSLIASSTEMVFALGCEASLVGRSHECDHPAIVRDLPAVTRPKFALDGTSYAIDQRVRALVEQGMAVYAVDADLLVALEPDVILTQIQCEVCAVSEGEVIAAVGDMLPEARIVALNPGALEDIWRDILRVAEALHVPDRGVQEVARLRRRMQAIETRARAFDVRPRVACIEWIDPLMAAGHWTPELIRMAGGEDVIGTPGAHAPLLPWAELAAADPDVVIVAPCGFDLARSRAEMETVRGSASWRGLRAVREGRLFIADGNAYFNRPGPRVAETLEIAAEILHPDAFRFGHEGTGWIRMGA
jgi:iron complex transport system substrate-binding protein